MFSVSITHHSKIRELSDGNRDMVMPNGLLVMGPTIFELRIMETKLWVMEIDDPNTPLKSQSIESKSRLIKLCFHLTAISAC